MPSNMAGEQQALRVNKRAELVTRCSLREWTAVVY
jgi:hypothetical protein